MNKPTLQVCLTNSLMNLYQQNINEKLVVFIDVLRNTSTITAALFFGIERVKPVSTVEEAKAFLGKNNCIVAGERQGVKIAEFDADNSPLFFKDANNNNQTLVITSTNGTQSVKHAQAAKVLCCGGFVNQTALISFIRSQQLPTLLLASGWRGNVNIEDTLFAGALVHHLRPYFDVLEDSALISEQLYQHNKNNITELISNASHYNRISVTKQKKDVNFCLSVDVAPVVPIYDGEFLKL